MIHLIMGLKGSGKTKKLIDAINTAVAVIIAVIVIGMLFRLVPG